MNKLSFYIILLITMLSWLLGGCGKTRHDDARLQHADSLMSKMPDSALSLLSGLDASSFNTQSDRAYHALLLTQAHYRCYQVATSDSLINVALDYYISHASEQERLTRALIYKGAVMEELGQAEVAMTFYKQALETVSPEDNFNKGYIRLRIGNIYRNHIVADSSDIVMLKEALQCFKMVPDSFYILTCLCEIGSSYCKTNADSVLPYLYQADSLARILNAQSIRQINSIYIAEHKLFSQDPRDVDEAKLIALSLLKDADAALDNHEDILMIAAYALAREHKPDSAQLLLGKLNKTSLSTPNDSVLYYLCKAEIAMAQGEINQFKHYFEKADQIGDSLTTQGLQWRLREVETKYNNEKLRYENQRYRNLLTTAVLAGLLLLCLLTIAILLISKRNSKQRQLIKDSQDTIERLHDEAVLLSAQLDDNREMSEKLKTSIRGQMDAFTKILEEHFIDTTKSKRGHHGDHRAIHPDASFWDGIRFYVDSTYNDIISQTEAANPALIESDVQFLSLYCCGLPTTVIMACMGYNDPHSVYNKRHRVATLLGLSGSLEDYIAAWKQRHQR